MWNSIELFVFTCGRNTFAEIKSEIHGREGSEMRTNKEIFKRIAFH